MKARTICIQRIISSLSNSRVKLSELCCKRRSSAFVSDRRRFQRSSNMRQRFSPQVLRVLLITLSLVAAGEATAQQNTQDLPRLLLDANQKFADGQYIEAAQGYEKVLRIAPQSTGAHNNLAICYGQLRKYAQAIDEFKTALSLSKESPEIHLNLGTAYLLDNKNEDALGSFQQALRLRPDWIAAEVNLGVALS